MDPDKRYTITLADGTKLENLMLNGNNFISEMPINKSVFDFNLETVTFSGGDWQNDYVQHNMELVYLEKGGDGNYWFILDRISQYELDMAKIAADIDYLYMMADLNRS